MFSPEDAKAAFDLTADFVRDNPRRDAGTECGKAAARWLADRISAAGGKARLDCFRAMSPDGMREFVNLYCAFERRPGTPWTVLVSHYDTKPGTGCPGANDGASTSGLLIGLANAFSNWREPKGNLMLVWTDGEECMRNYGPNDGFWGSKRAAEYLEGKNREVQAVICVDMLGDRDLDISIPSNGSPTLAKIALHAAKRVGCPELVKLGNELVKDDHVAFMEKGFKAIDLIDFNYGPSNSHWHTPQDTMDKVSEESLLKSGRVVAEMLNILL